MSSNDRNDPTHNTPQPNRPFSIDLSLELERQLENEEPASPTHDAKTHPHQSRESLDPHILASIVLQLRHSLAAVTKERDDLASLVPSLKDSLEHMTNKCTVMEEELHEARIKAKDDEEAISLLRSKVEESRRGLMRLQNESRRTSMVPAPIDVSRAGASSMAALKSARRQSSFTPRTGSGVTGGNGSPHARHSSVTEIPIDIVVQSASPNTAVFSCDTPGSSSHPPSSTRRLSSFFSRASPESAYDPVTHELEGLRRELQTLKEELDTTRTERDEAKEMRDASESCALALREFITQNNIGPGESPVMSTPTISRPEPMRKASSWGFGSLFNKTAEANSNPNEPVAPVAAPRTSASSWEQSPTVSNRKLGGFFSSRASVSSTSSQPLQVPFGHESDTSSIEETPEPISPSQDTNTKVRVNSAGASSSTGASLIDIQSIDGVKSLPAPPLRIVT